MTGFVRWIRNHQVAAFFIITFAISWGLGFSLIAVYQREQYLLLPLAFVATCGPGLAGILVSALTNTRPRQGSRKAFWLAFLVAWVIAALVSIANLGLIEQVALAPPVIILFVISIVPVPFIIASAWSRIPNVRGHLASLVRFRGVWGWALLALVLFPAIHLASQLVTGGIVPPRQFTQAGLGLVGLVIIRFLYQFFFFNATGEEVGWRGFALPRLQALTSPLVAALVIGLFWAPWHFFGWMGEGQPTESLDFWGIMFAGHMLLSILIVWIYNRSGGSILVAGIAHAAINTVQAFIPVTDAWGVLYPALAIAAGVMILLDRMWQKLPPGHPAVYRPPDPVP